MEAMRIPYGSYPIAPVHMQMHMSIPTNGPRRAVRGGRGGGGGGGGGAGRRGRGMNGSPGRRPRGGGSEGEVSTPRENGAEAGGGIAAQGPVEGDEKEGEGEQAPPPPQEGRGQQDAHGQEQEQEQEQVGHQKQ